MWEIIEGGKPVLLVAGHNVPHLRNGIIKKRDWGTGDMVRLLCEKTGAMGIVATQIQTDHNYHEEAPLRNEIQEIILKNGIRMVIDVHGRRKDYPYLIEFFANKHFDSSLLLGEPIFMAGVRNQKLLINSLEVAAVEVEIRRDGRTWGTPEFEEVVEKLTKLIKSPTNTI